jgi:3D-(3,5/4)-trihydroxycyclohexane-1,2-dione acylhydrolase (decyclizing)
VNTIRLTTAQAIVRWLVAQRTEVGGAEVPLFPGVFAIFGHGNVTCLGHALEEAGDDLPTWRGQNEQGMALAAVAYAKAMRCQQVMVATSSVGPGATNMVTAAAVALANRLPLLLLAGDTFNSRIPDPVLQQVEHPGAPSTTVNDAFRPVVRYWDRITHPAQLVQSLPAALHVMLDPATRGPAFVALPQDVQADAYDYPERFFEPVVHALPRPRAGRREVEAAARALRDGRRPLLIAGGGVHHSQAEDRLARFAHRHAIPVVETVAGKATMLGDDPGYVGPIGVIGCTAANNLAAEADVVLAVGTRLQDFTTGSWTVFRNDHAVLIGVNAARFDATKHRSLAVVGDAAEVLDQLGEALAGWRAPEAWSERAAEEKAGYRRYLDAIGEVRGSEGRASDGDLPTYAQVVAAVNRVAGPTDVALTAAGGLPGELNNGWWSKGVGTFDCEYGFSCMGYELSGGWGAAMARAARGGDGDVFVFVGDGSYLMMNSDLYSSVLSGHKYIAVVCDNGGYAVINRLQVNQGGRPFNNLLEDCRRAGEVHPVDFAAHAAAMGCRAETVSTVDELAAAVERARASDRTAVIVIRTHPDAWTEGGAFWEVGVPEVSSYAAVRHARQQMDKAKLDQRVGW